MARKQIFRLICLLGIVTLFASCNRGVGCPSDFSLEAPVKHLVEAILSLF